MVSFACGSRKMEEAGTPWAWCDARHNICLDVRAAVESAGEDHARSDTALVFAVRLH